MRALALGLAFLLPAAPAAAAPEVLPEIAKMEAEGEKWFNEATNTDLSPSERNEARKKAWVQLYPAKEALDKHWDAHPGDQGAIVDRVTNVGKMVFWLRKETPMGILESTGIGPQPKVPSKPSGWGEKPPPEKPGSAPEAPPAKEPPPPQGGPAAPAAPARRSIEEAYKEADALARKNRGDLAGNMERFQALLAEFPDQTAHPLFLEAAKRAAEASRALKDFYRVKRNDDPDSVKGVDSAEVRSMVTALAGEMQSKDAEVRRRAAGLLGLLGSGEGVFPVVQAAQREKDPGALAAEIDAAVAIGGRKAAEHLGKQREHASLAKPVLEALGRMCEKNSVDRRLAALELGKFAMVKDEAHASRAVDILVGLGPDGSNGLLSALNTTSTELRLKLIPAVVKTNNPRVAGPLSKFLIGGDNPATEACKKAAMDAIKSLGEPAVPYLFAGLRNPDTKQWTAFLLREMTGQPYTANRPGDWQAWWKRTHPEWKEEKE